MKKIIETERLILREFNANDSKFILDLLNTPAWIKYIGNRGVHSIEDAQSYIMNGPAKSYETNGFGLWMIELKSTGTAMGMCGLIKRAGLEDIDIGFALLPGYEGKGYAYEAASATMDFARKKDIPRVVAITLEHNENSIRLLKRIGLQFEKMITLPGDDEELMLFGVNLHPYPPVN